MKYRLTKFPLIQLLLLYSSFVKKKKVFYSKNSQYAYNFSGTDLCGNACRGVFRTHSNIYGGASLRKLQE